MFGMKLAGRIFAVLLSVMMIVTYMPAMAFAEGEGPEAASTAEELTTDGEATVGEGSEENEGIVDGQDAADPDAAKDGEEAVDDAAEDGEEDADGATVDGEEAVDSAAEGGEEAVSGAAEEIDEEVVEEEAPALRGGDEGDDPEDPEDPEDPIDSVVFERDGNNYVEITENSGGTLVNEGEEDEYYLYSMMLKEGDKVTVSFKDGTSYEYVYHVRNYDEGYDEEGFYLGEDPVQEVIWNKGISSDQSFENKWVYDPESTAEYSFELNFYSDVIDCAVSARIPVILVADPVLGIEFERADGSSTIELAENTHGESEWDYVDDDNEIQYFRYYSDPSRDGDKIYVMYTDGSETEYVYDSDRERYVNPDDSSDALGWNDLDWENNQSPKYPWLADKPEGASYYYTLTYKGGKSVIIPVTIVSNGISKIEYRRAGDEQSYTFIEGKDGYESPYYYYEGEEEIESSYFRYSSPGVRSGDQLIITKNGEEVTYTFSYDYDAFVCGSERIDWDDFDWIDIPEQTYEEPWTAGNTYGYAIKYKGVVSEPLPVYIAENPIQGISFERGGENAGKPYELVKDKDGYITSGRVYDEETEEENEVEYFRYTFPGFEVGDRLTVHGSEDKVYEYGTYTDKYGDREYGFINTADPSDIIDSENVDCDSDQSASNQWEVGGEYSFSIQYNGRSAEVAAVIVESPVIGISFSRPGVDAPYELTEGVDGRYRGYSYYDDYYEDEGDDTRGFAYSWSFKPGDIISVETASETTDYVAVADRTPGSTEVERFENPNDPSDFIYENEISCSSDQKSYNYWQAGEEGHSFTLNYYGAETTVEVSLTESPYTDLTFTPKDGKEAFTFIEDIDYYYPRFAPGDKITLSKDDGSEVTYTYQENEEYNYEFRDENHNRVIVYWARSDGNWEAGEEGLKFDLCCNGAKGTFPVEIEANEVEGIEFSVGDHPPYEFTQDISDYDVYYSRPEFDTGDSITLIYKDGSRVTYVYDKEVWAFVNGDDKLNNEYIDFGSDQWDEEDGHNSWGIGPHEFTVYYMNFRAETKLPVVVVAGDAEQAVKSVSVEPVADFVLVEGRDGHWDKNDQNESFWVYDSPQFRYGDKLVVTYNNDEVEKYEYRAGDNDDGYFVYTDADGHESKRFNSWRVNMYADQDESEPWQPGQHYLTLWFSGIRGNVPVTVLTAEEAESVYDYVPLVPAKCESNGKSAHWKDSDGNLYLKDGEQYLPVTDEDLKLPATGHQHVYHSDAAAPTCMKIGSCEYWYCEDCHKTFSDSGCTQEIEDPAIAATGHSWGTPQYTWAGDNSSVTAVSACPKCGREKSETAAAVIGESEATCTQGGSVTYTASFRTNGFEEQSKTVDSPALGHDFGEPEYTWAEDNSSVTASRACQREGCTETEEVTAAATSEVVKAPTCTGKGKIKYTAAFEAPFETQTKTVRTGEPTGHNWGAWTVLIPATCQTEGRKMRVCNNDPMHVEVIDTGKGDHVWTEPEYEWTEDYTYVTGTAYCSVEGCEYHDEPYTDTTSVDSEITKEATDEEDGIMTYTAEFNDGPFVTQTKEVPLSEAPHYHNNYLEWVESTPATCTENGMQDHYICTVCHKLFNYDYDVEDWVEVTADDLVIPATGHNPSLIEGYAPDCENVGYEGYYQCEYCYNMFSDEACEHQIYEQVEIPALGHAWDNGYVDTEPTEETSGLMIFTCTRCGVTRSQEIPPTGHSHDIVHSVEIPATCTSEGTAEYWYCSSCGMMFSDEAGQNPIPETVSIPKTAHVLEAHEREEAGCTTPGHEAYWECSNCHKLFDDEDGRYEIDEPVVIPAGHILTAYERVEPQCGVAGTEAYWECSRCHKLFSDEECGNEITEPIEIPALEHDLTAHAKVESQCGVDGTEAYWECELCSRLFSDANAENEIEAPVTIPALEHQLTAHARVEAGCETDGTEAYWECDLCGRLFSDADGENEIEEPAVIPAGHKLAKVEARAATCTTTGNTEYWTCSVCHKLFSDAEGSTETTLEDVTLPIEANAHAWGAWTELDGDYHRRVCGNDPSHFQDAAHEWGEGVETTPSTCISTGVKTYTCSVCGATKTETIPMKEHSLTKVEAKAATCFAAGNTEYWECSECHKLFSDKNGTTETTLAAVTIPALEHQLTAHAKVEPKCGVAGTEAYWECGVCHKFFSDEACEHEIGAPVAIPALEHQPAAHAKVEPKCGVAGTEAYWECSLCHKLFSDEACEHEIAAPVAIPALEHQLTAHARVDAGCETDGTEAYWECSACHKLFSDEACEHEIEAPVVIPAGHKLTKVAAKAATCQATGNTEYWECSECHKLFSDEHGTTETTLADVTIAKTPHTDEEIPAVAATCTEAGSTAGKKCSVCGEILEAPVEIPAHGHEFGAWTVSKKATTLAAGQYKRTCKHCSKVETKAIAKNNMTAKAKSKTLSAKAKAKTTIKASKAYKITNAKGKLSYKLVKGDKKITVAKNGKITVKKGLKKGKTYTIKVKVTSAATAEYAVASKTIKLKIKVK